MWKFANGKFIFSIFQDAFLSEKYGELVTKMLEGYVPFAIRSSYTIYVNGDGFDKRHAFSNPSFRREFWRACEWLYSKLNFVYREKLELVGCQHVIEVF